MASDYDDVRLVRRRLGFKSRSSHTSNLETGTVVAARQMPGVIRSNWYCPGCSPDARRHQLKLVLSCPASINLNWYCRGHSPDARRHQVKLVLSCPLARCPASSGQTGTVVPGVIRSNWYCRGRSPDARRHQVKLVLSWPLARCPASSG